MSQSNGGEAKQDIPVIIHPSTIVVEPASNLVINNNNVNNNPPAVENNKNNLIKKTPYEPPSPKITKGSLMKGGWFWRNKLKFLILGIVVLVVTLIVAIPGTLFTFGKVDSVQTFTFATLSDATSIDMDAFVSFVADVSGIPPKCLSKSAIKTEVSYNNSLVVDELIILFKCKSYTSNEFRDRMYSRLAAGKFASYQIIGFGEGGQIPRNICDKNHYGISCTPCKSCSDPLICDDGSLGTGICKCASDFIGPVKDFTPGKRISDTGRCLMMTSTSIDFGKVNVGGIGQATFLVYNVGNKTSNVANIYVEAIPSDDGTTIEQASAFSIISMPTLPLTFAPGDYFNVTLTFSPDQWGLYSAYMGIYLHDSETTPPDDVIQAINLTGLGSIGGVVPDGDTLNGTFPIYRIDCGNSNPSTWGTNDWEVDSYFSTGTAKSSSGLTSALGTVIGTYRVLDSKYISGYVNGYRFPIKYPGKLDITLYFAEPTATAEGARVFDVTINGVAVATDLDVFAQVGSGKYYALKYSVASALNNALTIDFKPSAGFAIINAIEIYQTLNVKLSTPTDNGINYAEALHKNYLFYEAQKSGPMGKTSRLAWRSDSCKNCKGAYGEDLSKGYYEAGNYLKLNFPMCWSLTSIAWGYILSPKGHSKASQSEVALDTLKWGTDYLIASHPMSDKFALSVGWSKADFNYFGPPESYETYVSRRDVFYITTDADNRSSETLGECAAALAAAAIVFKNTDAAYANTLLTHAEQLLNLGVNFPGSHMDSTNPGFQQMAKLYASYDYNDELSWGAAWVYAASGESSYLTIARKYYDLYIQTAQCGWAYSWEEKGPGLSILLSKVDPDGTRKAIYDKYSKCHLDQWLPGSGRTVPHTPRGLAFRLNWGACRFAANVAFLSFAYYDSLNSRNIQADYQKSLYVYGKSQVDYMLGKYGRSYMAGYGALYAKYIWHKSSYNSMLYWPVKSETWYVQSLEYRGSYRPQTHILYGALVGGPIAVSGMPTDFFLDNRSSYVYTEVTIDYNAAFGGALAFLTEKEGGTPVSDSDLDLGFNFVPPSYTYDPQLILQSTPAPTTST